MFVSEFSENILGKTHFFPILADTPIESRQLLRRSASNCKNPFVYSTACFDGKCSGVVFSMSFYSHYVTSFNFVQFITLHRNTIHRTRQIMHGENCLTGIN